MILWGQKIDKDWDWDWVGGGRNERKSKVITLTNTKTADRGPRKLENKHTVSPPPSATGRHRGVHPAHESLGKELVCRRFHASVDALGRTHRAVQGIRIDSAG